MPGSKSCRPESEISAPFAAKSAMVFTPCRRSCEEAMCLQIFADAVLMMSSELVFRNALISERSLALAVIVSLTT